MSAHAVSQPLNLARLLPGLVGESRRVVHLIPVTDQYPGGLTALCGEVFYSGDLEFLAALGGMPCERCAIASPGRVTRPGLREA
jgi:hypothetical protein